MKIPRHEVAPTFGAASSKSLHEWRSMWLQQQAVSDTIFSGSCNNFHCKHTESMFWYEYAVEEALGKTMELPVPPQTRVLVERDLLTHQTAGIDDDHRNVAYSGPEHRACHFYYGWIIDSAMGVNRTIFAIRFVI